MRDTILKELEKIPYFSTEAVRQLAGDAKPSTILRQLSRWERTGKLIRLKKGIYMADRFYRSHASDPSFLPAVSNIIFPYSYTSTTYELQRRGVLSEATYPITAITYKRTRSITNILGNFDYQNIKESLYRGFERYEYHGIIYYRATSAKALFDYLYLRTIPRSLWSLKVSLVDEFRLNMDVLTEEDWLEFSNYVQESDSEKMSGILINLMRNVWQL